MSNKKQRGNEPLIDVTTFAFRYGLSDNTIKKNIDKIPGAYKKGKEYIIPDSARYPYKIGRASIRTRDDKRYILLKATSCNRYIDEKMIGLSKSSFRTMINELIQQGLLIENGSGNKNGANNYDTSSIADEILKNGKRRAIIEIGKAVAVLSGTFAAQLIQS